MSSESPIQVEDLADVRVISFGGMTSISGSSVAVITEPLLNAIDQRETAKVIVDLQSVQFFNSSFIELLFRVWNRIKSREGGRFALCNVHPYCQEVLDVTNLTAVWKVFPTRDEAMQAMSQTASWTAAHS